MGEKANEPFHLSFNASLRVDSLRITSHLRWRPNLGAGVGGTSGLGELIDQHLTDPREKI